MAHNPTIRPQHNLMIKYLKKLMTEEELENLIDRYIEVKIEETQKSRFSTCPRCGEEHLVKPIYRNALSRKSSVDNEVFICSWCGTDEAVNEYMKNEPKKWAIPTKGIEES